MDHLTAEDFWRDQRQLLLAVIGAHCGDADVAEDIVQDALLRASENWDDVRGMDAPNMWLRRVALNLTSSHYRRRRVEQRVVEQLAAPDGWAPDSDPAVRLALLRALETLPSRQRAAVALRYWLDWSVADVAEILGTSEANVKVLTHRGVTKLRDHFGVKRGREETWRRVAGAGFVLLVVATAAALAVTLRGQVPGGVYIDPPIPLEQMESTVMLDRCPASGGGQVAAVRDGDALLTVHVTGDRYGTCAIPDVYGPRLWWVDETGVFDDFDPNAETLAVDGVGVVRAFEGGSGRVLTYLHGRVGADVARVVVTRDDGTEVEAVLSGTVMEEGVFVSEGHFVAMWASSGEPHRLGAFAEDGRVLVDRVLDGWLEYGPYMRNDDASMWDQTPYEDG